MTCDFMPFLTLFQSYQDDGRVVMKAPYNEGPFRIRHNLASCRPSTFKQETKFYKSYRQLVMVQFRFLIMTHLIWPDDYVVMFFFLFFFCLFIYLFFSVVPSKNNGLLRIQRQTTEYNNGLSTSY